MSSYTASPGPFKAREADPEATLEVFEDYLIVEGGHNMNDLFKYVGKVEAGDTYAQAVTKIKDALKKRGNRTSAVFKLFNGHSQGS